MTSQRAGSAPDGEREVSAEDTFPPMKHVIGLSITPHMERAGQRAFGECSEQHRADGNWSRLVFAAMWFARPAGWAHAADAYERAYTEATRAKVFGNGR